MNQTENITYMEQNLNKASDALKTPEEALKQSEDQEIHKEQNVSQAVKL